MSGTSTTETAHFDRAQYLHSKWGWFLVLGLVLASAGALAVALPTISTFAASVVLGVVLALAGVVKMVQSLQVKWSGFIWQELAGARQAVGVTIFGGMLAATTIGLFIIPTLFAVIERLVEWARRDRKQQRSHR
jgi:uncharacterized membrane protein HdeD (DUF308 family)